MAVAMLPMTLLSARAIRTTFWGTEWDDANQTVKDVGFDELASHPTTEVSAEQADTVAALQDHREVLEQERTTRVSKADVFQQIGRAHV